MQLILYNFNISNLRITNSLTTCNSGINNGNQLLCNNRSILTPTLNNFNVFIITPLKEFHTSAAPFGDPVKPDDNKPARLTNEQKAQFNLSTRQEEILIGCILGDLFIEKLKTSINSRLHFIQGTIQSDYLNHLYTEFQDLCPSAPKVRNPQPDKRTGKVYSIVRFNTYSLPCFNEFYNLFYVEGEKIVPSNIGDLLTALGLAYWICDDGTFDKSINVVILCTDSFTLEEVELLISVLNSKWDLKCYKKKITNGYRIVIPRKSLPILQSLLGPIMPPMMRHKIGL